MIHQKTRHCIRHRMIYSTVCTVFCCAALLFGCITLSFSWLSENRRVERQSDMQIEGDSVSAIAFTAYKFDDTANLGSVVSGENIILSSYDSVFTEKNQKKSLIFKAPVFGTGIHDGEPFHITLDLADRSSETGNHDNNHLNGIKEGAVATAVADYLSNIIYVRCAVIDTLQDDTPRTATEIYNTAYAYLSDPANTVETHTFFEGTDGAKVNTVEFTVQDYTSAMSPSRSVLYVYIEVGYDSELVSRMIESREMSISGSTLDIETIDIDSDLGRFLFSSAE